jgi:methylmalonyl-CoA mutase, C-terminal domain
MGGDPAVNRRVLLAKPGLDGHDRAVYIISMVLRDAGLEVVYTGLRQTPAQIAAAALDEDVGMVGLSILAGGHLGLVDKVMNKLEEVELDVPVVVGGVIPEQDVQPLLDRGVARVFPSSTPLGRVSEEVLDLLEDPGGTREKSTSRERE